MRGSLLSRNEKAREGERDLAVQERIAKKRAAALYSHSALDEAGARHPARAQASSRPSTSCFGPRAASGRRARFARGLAPRLDDGEDVGGHAAREGM